jgi:prepilin-type N-terminal cleavage/methylation domain-containing protein
MRRVTAFTLLELTVALVIVGLLMAFAAPRFAGLRDGAAVRGAMAELGATFSLARETAIARRTMVVVFIDTAAGTVVVRTPEQIVLRRGLRSTFGIVLGSNRDSTVYDARGLGYGVANLTVTIRRGAFVDTLTMSRLGRVRW